MPSTCVSPRRLTASVCSVGLVLGATVSRAQETAPPQASEAHPKTYPSVGGHLGTALPIITLGSTTTVIGGDFVTLGLTPGIRVHLDEDWAVDFEFIAQNELKNTPAATTFVVDPGVLRDFKSWLLGLRISTEVGKLTNGALVPIVIVPFKLSERISWFAEGDVPATLKDGVHKVLATVGFQLQTGFVF